MCETGGQKEPRTEGGDASSAPLGPFFVPAPKYQVNEAHFLFVFFFFLPDFVSCEPGATYTCIALGGGSLRGAAFFGVGLRVA